MAARTLGKVNTKATCQGKRNSSGETKEAPGEKEMSEQKSGSNGAEARPYWIKTWVEHRKWKSQKRKQVKVARKAVEQALRGCAYMTAYHEIVEAYTLLQKAEEKCKIKNWGK